MGGWQMEVVAQNLDRLARGLDQPGPQRCV